MNEMFKFVNDFLAALNVAFVLLILFLVIDESFLLSNAL